MTKSALIKLSSYGLSLSLLFSIAACAPFGQQINLENPVEASQLQLNNGKTAEIKANWWQQLDQPVLNQLLKQGLINAPDLRIAEARLTQAAAQWRLTQSAAGAQLNLRANGMGMYLNPKPDTSSLNRQANHVLGVESADIALSYNFDFWGRQRSLIQAALGQQQAAQYQRQQAELLLIQNIVAQYTQWQLLTEQTVIIDKRIKIHERLQTLLNERIRAGLQAESDIYAQTQSLLSLQSAQRQTWAEIEKVRNSLAMLTGQSPLALTKLQPQPLNNVPTLELDQLQADILAIRPDIAVQTALLESKYFGIKAAKAEFYPNIRIEALAGLSHLNIFDLMHSSSRMLQLLPAVSLPIFTSGRLQANLSARQAEYNEQVAQYDKTVMTALQQAADAINAYQQSQAGLLLQKQAWQIAQKNAQASSRRQQAGLDNALMALQREDMALTAKNDYLKIAAWHQQSWNNVHTALGGGIQIKSSNSLNN